MAHLREMIEMILGDIYPKWELLAGGSCTMLYVLPRWSVSQYQPQVYLISRDDAMISCSSSQLVTGKDPNIMTYIIGTCQDYRRKL